MWVGKHSGQDNIKPVFGQGNAAAISYLFQIGFDVSMATTPYDAIRSPSLSLLR
jgi:hypothetical protein